MRKLIFYPAAIFALTVLSLYSQAQLKVGDNPALINPKAVLDLESTTKGLLLPRMSTLQRTAITSPPAGLQVYDTTTNSVWYFNGTVWVVSVSSNIYTADGTLTGARTVTQGTNNITFGSTATTTTAQNLNANSLTTGTAQAITANALTTGTGLSVSSSSAGLSSTNGLLQVANTGASTTGILARFQANATAGSGMTVTNSGNVGIGTNTPSAALHINSAVATSDLLRLTEGTGPTINDWSIDLENAGAQNGFTSKRSLTLVDRSSNARRMTISESGEFRFGGNIAIGNAYVAINEIGNVGVGTTTPSERLNVNGGNVLVNNTPNPLIRIQSSANVLGQGGQIEFNETTTDWGTRLRHSTGGDASNAEGLYVEGKVNNIYTPIAVFDQNNARVGIGTSVPSAVLTSETPNISGKALNLTRANVEKLFFVPQLTNGSYNGLSSVGDVGIFFGNSTGNVVPVGAATSRGLVIGPWSDNANLPAMKITEAGNVGIGTSTPPAKLSVLDAAASSTIAQFGNSTATLAIGASNSFNNTNFGSNAANYAGSGINVMILNHPGTVDFVFGDNVSPWSTGDYDLGRAIARWENIYLTNNPDVSSDRRLKSNIVASPYGLNEIMRMTPKQYDKYRDFDKTGNPTMELGLIAQDLAKIVPIAVSGKEDDKIPMGVKYEQLIPVLIRGMQEQQVQIELLKKEIQILKNK